MACTSRLIGQVCGMGIVEKDAEDVIKAIGRWDPGTAFSEVACHRSLAKFLQQAFPKQNVLSEYPIGRGRADLFLDFKDWTARRS